MEEKMQDVGSGNPGNCSDGPSTSTNIVRLNILDMREAAENLMMDSGPPNGKITSVDSGIETGNDSNDSAIVPIETRQLSVVSDNFRRRTSLDTFKRWSLEMQEICQPFSSMSSDAIEAACSVAKTNQPSSSSGQIALLRDYYLKRSSVDKKLTFECRSRNKWRPCKVYFPYCRSLPGARTKCLVDEDRMFKRVEQYGRGCDRRLRVAAACNDVEQVQCQLAKGANPNSCDEQLRTPLHLSSGRGYTEVVRLLLRHGANPSVKDCIGNTPLHLAAATSKISVVTLLLEAGCDPLSPDLHGYNPLQLAETKLRLLQNCKGDDMLRIKSEVREVVNMLVAYLKNRDGFRDQVDALSTFCSRLTLSNTSNQVQDEVRDLLCNIDSLNLKS